MDRHPNMCTSVHINSEVDDLLLQHYLDLCLILLNCFGIQGETNSHHEAKKLY